MKDDQQKVCVQTVNVFGWSIGLCTDPEKWHVQGASGVSGHATTSEQVACAHHVPLYAEEAVVMVSRSADPQCDHGVARSGKVICDCFASGLQAVLESEGLDNAAEIVTAVHDVDNQLATERRQSPLPSPDTPSMENEESCEHCSAILLPRRRAPVLCESCVPICDDSCAHFDEDKPTPVPTCASSDLPARIVRALADYGCLSDGGGIEDEEPSEEDTEEMERVARGVVATMLSAKPPTVHVLDDDEIAERIATAACDALDACEGDADDAFEQAKRAIVCEVKLLLALPSPIVETEPEHEDGCASQYEDTRDPSVTDVVCACDCKLSAIAAWSGDHCTCDHGEGRGETLWCDLGILIRAIGISDPMRYLPDYTTTVTLLRKTWEALNNSNARDSMMEATRTAAERLAAARTKEPTP